MATTAGTWSYRDRFGDAFARTFFRRFGPGVVSSIGVGTYLGDATDDADADYREAVRTALDSGINLVDTAVNYRCQRSERAVGDALRESDADRSEVVLATKGGFVPFDGSRPDDPGAYVRDEFVRTGLVGTDDLAHGSHSLAPGFLAELFDRSLENLGVDAVDCYYVHNPETQLAVRSREDVYDQLEAAFELLEEKRLAGELGVYGVATWEAFRVPRGHDSYLSLPEVVARAERAAESAGADDCGFSAVQLPFNVQMADAFTVEAHAHPDGDGDVSALWYAQEAGLDVFASASLGQGSLAASIPETVDAQLSGDTAAQRAINFARSAPGVTGALVGTGSPEHVAENVAAGTFEPLGARAFDAVFE
ncbi:aldo/keto reductase [Halogeometricum limi]|uniref:Predicted oxidoreductase n=1 Tax=Halogeometricum limi TaxID=555875 RepID=A0A1I6G6G8_9EURY|nr:aldo/keto reductase [Halogeometricum limi]SFR37779.1 Predicted oxidoreductase [Halogeometricum limi]